MMFEKVRYLRVSSVTNALTFCHVVWYMLYETLVIYETKER